MSAPNRYLLAYDISDPKRLRRVHEVAMTFGYPLQYSLFVCDLDPVDAIRLKDALRAAMHERLDRVSIFDLGTPSGRGVRCVEQLGRPHPLPKSAAAEIW